MLPTPTIAILPLPNFTLMPMALFVDILRLSADEGDRSRQIRLKWTFVAPTMAPVRASCGLAFDPWEALGDPARFDYVVVCGGLLRRRHDQDEMIEGWLRQAAEAGVTIIGLCTGVFTMAQAGLLAQARVCVSWYHVNEFLDEYPDAHVVATDLFVVDGTRVTCAGGRGAADLATWIIGRHAGEPIARKALDILLIGQRRPGDELQPRPPMADGIKDERVRRAILLMEERLDRALPMPVLARAVGLSRRQFERLFIKETGHSPASFGLIMRLRCAEWLLATTDRALTTIAMECGFSDISHFARRYRKHYKITPSEARKNRAGFVANERRPYSSVETAPANLVAE